MKYYKDNQNKVYAFESNGSQDKYIPYSFIQITEDQANALRLPIYTPPTVVTMRQARLMLLQQGYLTQVNALIQAWEGTEGDQARIDWEFATEVKRNHPLVDSIRTALSLSDSQLDEMFIQGALL